MLIATRRRTWGPQGKPPVVLYNYKHDRVSALAESAVATGNEDMARELFAVERALGGALRRLRRFSQTA